MLSIALEGRALGVTDEATYHETAFFELRTGEETSTPFFATRTESTDSPASESFFAVTEGGWVHVSLLGVRSSIPSIRRDSGSDYLIN